VVESTPRVNTLLADIRLQLSASFQLDCRFEAPSGFTVLFGPSGAGKTSVLDCIAGIKSPDSGRIVVGGLHLFDSDRRLNLAPPQRHLAYVFQSLALFPHLNVAENVVYGIATEPKAEREERCRQILQQFGISGLSSRRPSDLSGGERQRVALARSLLSDPRVLLLDEPLIALDRVARMKILDDLRAWNEAHSVPILYVTHSVREAIALGERVLMMQNGTVIATGQPSELLDAQEWD